MSRGVEWEFDKVTFSREFPRNVVTKLLVEPCCLLALPCNVNIGRSAPSATFT